jgi:hypothetical protein
MIWNQERKDIFPISKFLTMINLRKESEEKQVLAPIIDMEFLKVETK